MLEIGAVLLFIIGCGMVFDGCTSNLNESLKSEGSAIRQTVYTIQYSLGFTVICLSMILAALVRIIRKP